LALLFALFEFRSLKLTLADPDTLFQLSKSLV